MMSELTQKYVRSLFDYRDGKLYRKVGRGNRKIGDLVGSDQGNGYLGVTVDRKHYYVHRVIFMWHYDYLPEFLDHIDGDKSNNNISNLRGATKQQNGMNRGKNKSYAGKPTSSDHKGITWHKPTKKMACRNYD